MKTFIKWSGNKSRYLKHLLPLMPTKYNNYIEPFIGSGAVFLNVAPLGGKWIVGDINEDLVNVWKCIADEKSLRVMMRIMKQFEAVFLKLPKREQIDLCRKMTNGLEDEMPFGAKRAAWFLILKHCVYMGILLRGNHYYFRGLDMSIYGKDRLFGDGMWKNLREVGKFLGGREHGEIVHGEYRDVLKRARRGDFVFLDPPYIEGHKYDFKYNKHEKLTGGFLKELRAEVEWLDARGVKWMMTQADTLEVRRIFKGYVISKYRVYRRQGDRYVSELIIRNYIS